MRTLRRPLKAKFENRSSSTTSGRFSGISKPKKLQKSLNSLSTFLTRFDQIDHTIFETVTSLNSFICDILNSTQKHPSHVDYSEFLNTWAKIKTQLSNNIITLNNTQMSTLIEKELNAFMGIINQVESSPPLSQKQQRDSKTTAKAISNVINSAKDSSRRKQFDKLKIQMQNLKNDIGYQYESFFKFSQISKEWKDTIIDDCRKYLDKIISFCDIGKDLGLTQFPFVDEISILLSELANESEILRDNAKSLIPRHSPMKFEQRKAAELADNDDKTPVKLNQSKIKKVPNSARSKSEQSSSKMSRIPKPKEQTTPDRSVSSKKVRSSFSGSIAKNGAVSDSDQGSRTENMPNDKKPKTAMSARLSKNSMTKKDPIRPPPSSRNANEDQNSKPKPALSRSQKPARSSSTSHSTKTAQNAEKGAKDTNDTSNIRTNKKKEIVPLQESPKIQRKPKSKNSLAGSQQVEYKKLKLHSEEESSTNSDQNENNEQVAHFVINDNDDLIDNAKSDLHSFEQRFLKYVATVGTSDLLGRFVNELRMTQKAIENDQNSLSQHVSRLNNLMNQIEEQINISKPLFEIEQNLAQALGQMSSLSNSMVSSVASNAELAEANAIFKQYEIVKEKLEKVASDRKNIAENELTKQIQTELTKFQEAESTFKNAQENNETLKRLRKENIEMRKEMQNLNNSNKNESQQNSDKYRKIIIEMKAVNQRMAEIQIEKKENPDDIEEIDAELEALLEQQSGLIEQLNSFEF